MQSRGGDFSGALHGATPSSGATEACTPKQARLRPVYAFCVKAWLD